MLPADLRQAEVEALAALRSALADDPRGRWTVEFRFEGLKLLPLVLRLADQLAQDGPSFRLLFPDAGATALARRDAPDQAARIASFSDRLRVASQAAATDTATEVVTDADDAPPLLLLVGASPSDYELVEGICEVHAGAVVLINSSLEDAAVGIGSVARQRRRGFLAGWQAAYALMPLPAGALRRCWPDPWQLYRLDHDGYRAAATFEQKPDAEARTRALEGDAGQGLAAGLRAIDQLLDGLQN
jgi:hypothetical protein